MVKKVLVVAKHGKDYVEGAYSPFVFSLISRARGYDVKVFLMWGAVELAKKDVAQSTQAPDSPTLYEMMKDAIDNGTEVYVCDRSATRRGITTPDGFVEGVQFRDKDVELVDFADEADVVLEF
ncbi:MAG: DsrE family protein [Methermicoccaceae archaeon]